MKPGGAVYIETPNIDAYGHSKFKQDWRGLEVPRHLVIFAWEPLEAMLREVGLNNIVRKVRTDGYPRLAARSRAVRKNRDPYREGEITLADQLKGMSASLKTRNNYRISEYVTLVAYKPR